MLSKHEHKDEKIRIYNVQLLFHRSYKVQFRFDFEIIQGTLPLIQLQSNSFFQFHSYKMKMQMSINTLVKC